MHMHTQGRLSQLACQTLHCSSAPAELTQDMLHAGFSQGATAAAILLADLARSRPELLPTFCILVRVIRLPGLVSLRVYQATLLTRCC